jgi:PAS domain-containing protein
VELGNAPHHKLGIGMLFDTIRDAVVVASAETERIVLWNQTAARTFGYSAKETRSSSVLTAPLPW